MFYVKLLLLEVDLFGDSVMGIIVFIDFFVLTCATIYSKRQERVIWSMFPAT